MWMNRFNERQRKEIAFAKLYVERFGHGTDGHNAKAIIAEMAKMLDEIDAVMTPPAVVDPHSPYFAPGGMRAKTIWEVDQSESPFNSDTQ